MKLEDFDAVEIVPRDSKALGRKVFTAYFQKREKISLERFLPL